MPKTSLRLPKKHERSLIALMLIQTIYIDVLRKAGHPNILRYIDVERRNNEYWLITEFMKEGNLHDYLKVSFVTYNFLLREFLMLSTSV